jgi:uncharacterized membrane protein YfcA
MIYFIGLLVGILNGMFASGAGQILVFYLIFIKKIDTHIGRAISVGILSISSICTVIGFSSMVNYDITKIILFSIISLISGIVGAKLMKKISSNILNLISGILLVVLTGYQIINGGK